MFRVCIFSALPLRWMCDGLRLWLRLGRDQTPIPSPSLPPQYGLQSAASDGVSFCGADGLHGLLISISHGSHHHCTPTHDQNQAWGWVWTANCSTVHADFASVNIVSVLLAGAVLPCFCLQVWCCSSQCFAFILVKRAAEIACE